MNVAFTQRSTFTSPPRPRSSNHFAARRRSHASWLLVALCLLLNAASVWALPAGGEVAGGVATINQPTAGTMQIQQTSERALLNWQGFSIGGHETVQFVQPSTTSLAVNRVLGGDPSVILGQLLANGRVFLLNPNGILFGPNAVVNVGGLLATTLSLQSYDLNKGQFSFAQDPAKAMAAVVNQGSLRVADNGFIVLTAPGVVNEGLIVARFGHVGLSAGTRMAVDFLGDGLIQYAVDGKVLGQVTDPTGRPLASAVTNSGRIEADGGTVLLTAHASSAVLSSVINQTGIIQARRLEHEGGEIVLRGGDEGAVMVAGTLDAGGEKQAMGSGQWAMGETGGTITVRGDRIGLAPTAKLDVSGDTGGGRITVGGGFQGKDGGPNAQQAVVMPGAQLLANANTTGDGGTVVVWADGSSTFAGAISARGGAAGGNGGMAEVSGKAQLLFDGTVDLRAPAGAIGTLLLDPQFGVVGNNGAGTISGDILFGGAPNPGTTTIGANSLSTLLGTTAVTLQANSDWTFANNVNPVTGTHNLTVQAGRSIIFNSNAEVNLTGANFSASINDAGANATYRTAGTAQFLMNDGSAITTAGGHVTIDVGTFGSQRIGEVRIGDAGGGATIDGGTGGNIAITGFGRLDTSSSDSGNDGISVVNGSVIKTAGTGTITLTGTGGAGTDFDSGVVLLDPGTLVQTENGLLTIIGAASPSTTGGDNIGIVVAGATVVSIGTSSPAGIQLIGTGGAGTQYNDGVRLVDGAMVTTEDGPISIAGTAGPGTDAFSNSVGIYLEEGQVASAGTGNILVTGIGGNGTTDNEGVYIGFGAAVSSSGTGSMTVEGTGRGTGEANDGIELAAGGLIESTGSGAITLVGQGAAGGTNNNRGVTMTEGALVSSSSLGAIDINGTGGGTGENNHGVLLTGQATVQSTGYGAVSLVGSGSPMGTNNNVGVMMNGDGTTIQSAGVASTSTGAISITGVGGGIGAGNAGVVLTEAAYIKSINGAPITVSGQGAGTAFGLQSSSFGTNNLIGGPGASDITLQAGTATGADSISLSEVTIQGVGTLILQPVIATSSIGVAGGAGVFNLGSGELNLIQNGFVAITIGRTDGTGAVMFGTSAPAGYTFKDPFKLQAGGTGGTVALNGPLAMTTAGDGIEVVAGKSILLNPTSNVTTTGSGAITLAANAAAASTGNFVGVDVNGATLSAQNGAITVSGRGGNTGDNNFGIWLRGGGQIVSTGSVAATLELTGSGGDGGNGNTGIQFEGIGTTLLSNTGNIVLHGTGGAGATGNTNRGITLFGGASVQSNGPATVTLSGEGGGKFGGGRTAYNHGVVISDAGSQISSTGGDIIITGTGGGTAGVDGPNLGVTVALGGQVHGTGSAGVSITGVGGEGFGYSIITGGSGIYLQGCTTGPPCTQVTTVNGPLMLTGTAHGNGSAGYGVMLRLGALVQATGSGAVSLQGQGSTTATSFAHGVVAADAGTIISVHSGTLSLQGTAGGNGSGFSNVGVSIALQTLIQATGTGSISIWGTGGPGTSTDYGVYISASTIQTTSGNVQITGSGGGTPQSTGVVQVNSPVIQSTGGGTVTITSTPP